MNNHNHRMVLILMLLSLCLMLTACSTSTQSANSKDNGNAIAPASTITKKEEVELILSVAASLKDAMEEIKAQFEDHNPHIKLNFNFGGSGALQQQIEQGAPVDLFLSAASKPMTALVDKGIVAADQQQHLLANELVVIVPAGTSLISPRIAALTEADIRKVAIGIPESVPAGSYAKEAIAHEQLWNSLQDKLVQAKDVRQVLQYVETGNADAGFVYKTDAIATPKVTIAFEVNSATYSPIVYPAGIIQSTKHREEVEELFAYLQTTEAMNIFVKYGFSAAADR